MGFLEDLQKTKVKDRVRVESNFELLPAGTYTATALNAKEWKNGGGFMLNLSIEGVGIQMSFKTTEKIPPNKKEDFLYKKSLEQYKQLMHKWDFTPTSNFVPIDSEIEGQEIEVVVGIKKEYKYRDAGDNFITYGDLPTEADGKKITNEIKLEAYGIKVSCKQKNFIQDTVLNLKNETEKVLDAQNEALKDFEENFNADDPFDGNLLK